LIVAFTFREKFMAGDSAEEQKKEEMKQWFNAWPGKKGAGKEYKSISNTKRI